MGPTQSEIKEMISLRRKKEKKEIQYCFYCKQPMYYSSGLLFEPIPMPFKIHAIRCPMIIHIEQRTFGDFLYDKEETKWQRLLYELNCNNAHSEDYHNVCATIDDINECYNNGYYERLFLREKEKQTKQSFFKSILKKIF